MQGSFHAADHTCLEPCLLQTFPVQMRTFWVLAWTDTAGFLALSAAALPTPRHAIAVAICSQVRRHRILKYVPVTQHTSLKCCTGSYSETTTNYVSKHVSTMRKAISTRASFNGLLFTPVDDQSQALSVQVPEVGPPLGVQIIGRAAFAAWASPIFKRVHKRFLVSGGFVLTGTSTSTPSRPCGRVFDTKSDYEDVTANHLQSCRM